MLNLGPMVQPYLGALSVRHVSHIAVMPLLHIIPAHDILHGHMNIALMFMILSPRYQEQKLYIGQLIQMY